MISDFILIWTMISGIRDLESEDMCLDFQPGYFSISGKTRPAEPLGRELDQNVKT